MQSRLYHYEIDRALVNAIYTARNTNDGSTVTIYEWTPTTADRSLAKLRLAELLPELKQRIPAEVFTSDASLYLTASTPDHAETALAILQAHDLFLGFQVKFPERPQPSGDIVADYNTARESGEPGRDSFVGSYECFGLSCITNLNELVFNPNIVLRFRPDPYGRFLGIRHEGQTWLAPALDKELKEQAPFLSLAFDIPKPLSDRLALSSAGLIEQNGELWQLKKSGVIRLHEPSVPVAQGDFNARNSAVILLVIILLSVIFLLTYIFTQDNHANSHLPF